MSGIRKESGQIGGFFSRERVERTRRYVNTARRHSPQTGVVIRIAAAFILTSFWFLFASFFFLFLPVLPV
jgi:hypothetical protein